MIVAYRRTHSPSQMAWSEGRRPLGAVLYSSNEPSELSQWPVVMMTALYIYRPGIIIIIIIIIIAGCPRSPATLLRVQ